MNTHKSLPSFQIIKAQLRPLSVIERWSVVFIPLVTIVAYFVFAYLGWYVAALLSLVYLSFVTYGSCSHDLVHCNVGFSRRVSNFWLIVIEFLMMRSGTTYRRTHLNHHQCYPDFEKDPEGRASYYSFFRTLAEGPVFHAKLIAWMLKHGSVEERRWVRMEVAGIILFYLLGIFLINKFPALFIYQVTVTMGAWAIPFVTSYLVHVPHESEAIHQTKIFRGLFYRVIGLDHLYHLEHHLYAQVPHCRWKDLALILNPYFEQENLTALRFNAVASRNFELN